jgi:hypothetical protein
MKIEKLTPWLPLLIAAGYFLFLVATWQRFIMTDTKVKELIAKLEPKTTEGQE